MNAQDVIVEKPGETRTRRPKSMTRAAILARAYEMYLDRELIHGDERLSVVLDSLGYTTGAGYQIWPNQAAFRLDLQVYVAERIDYASLESIIDELQAIRDRGLPRDEHVLAIGDAYHTYFSGREEFYLVLRFYAMGEERAPEISLALRNAYTQLGWELESAFTAAWANSGRRLKSDRTMSQLVSTVTALSEGFALRDRVGPEIPLVEIAGGQHHAFSVAMLAVLDAYSEEV